MNGLPLPPAAMAAQTPDIGQLDPAVLEAILASQQPPQAPGAAIPLPHSAAAPGQPTQYYTKEQIDGTILTGIMIGDKEGPIVDITKPKQKA